MTGATGNDVRARLEWVDSARGLAILLVVVFHAVQTTTTMGIDHPQWVYWVEALRTLRMPLFFLAAGLFAGKWVRGSWPALLRAKVLLFVWLFLLWAVIRFVALSLDPAGRSAETGSLYMLLRVLWVPGVGWFIYVLALFFVVARATRQLDPRLQVAAAALVSGIWFAGFELNNHAWEGAGLYYVFFLLGIYYRELVFAWSRAGVVPRAASIPLWIALYVAAEAGDVLHVPGVGPVLCVAALAAGISVATFVQGGRLLRHLGRRTLTVYLTHQLILLGIHFAAAAVGGIPATTATGVLAPVVLTAAAVVIGLALGWAAPRVGMPWLFDTPRWLLRAFDAAGRQPKSPSRVSPK